MKLTENVDANIDTRTNFTLIMKISKVILINTRKEQDK